MALETMVDRELWDAATTNTDALEPWISPPAEGGLPSVFYEVDRTQPGQLYFMLAFPAMVLLELYARGRGDEGERPRAYRYCGTAARILAFLRGCDGINDSLFAHKAAVAFAMVGEHFGEDDLPPAISRYLVSQQRAHGGIADDADAMDTVDQTAEVACWLRMLPELAAATAPASWTVAGF